MSYEFWLDDTQLPVAPSKLTVKIKGNNKTITLINEGEINLLKMPGLIDISFSALLPNVSQPWARYYGASSFLDKLERLMTTKNEQGKLQPFQFKVIRAFPDGRGLFGNDVTVALESYNIADDYKQGFDTTVDITLRQYREYGTKIIDIKPPSAVQPNATATTEPPRIAENAPGGNTHTVVRGDTLWGIAKKYLGDGSRYPEIYEANKTEIDARNRGTGNTKYTIYPGQVFQITSNR